MKLDQLLDSRNTSSRLIGGLFLAGFLLYGVGFALVSSVIDRPHFLATVPEHRATLLAGAFLMLLNTVVDVGKGVLFFPILERHSKRAAQTYLATMVVEVVLLAGGALMFFLLVPLAEHRGAGWADGISNVVVDANASAYQLAEMLLGLGALALTVVLLRTGLVPRRLAALGVIGYPVLAVGSAADLLGAHVSLVLSIPGGLFEVGVAFWLIFRGFHPAAYAGPDALPAPGPVLVGAGRPAQAL
ncbi:hypothetical protein ACVW00_000760 [Marmoricola sp. URHA0025 HA25]